MNAKENAEKARFTMCLRLIMIGLLALSIIALFLFLSVSCDDEIEAKDIKFTIESESTKNIKYDRQTGEYTFYYGSEKGARLVIKASLVDPSESEKDFKDFSWTISSSAYGKEYTPLQTNCFYMRDDDTNITQRFARFNSNIFTINLDYIDTLSTYTITASYKDKKAEFILNVDSQRIIASTDFSISYCALNVKEDGTVSKTTGTNITSNIPPNTTLKLTKGMAYEIGFRNSIKNPFGTFTYTIEENNGDSGFFFIDDNSESLLTKSISTLASTPTVYIFVDSEKAVEDTPILIKASAGDKKTQTFYVTGKTKRDYDLNLDNLFSVNAFPVAGGYSVEFALTDKNYKDKYAIAYSVDGAVDREIIYFDDTLKATFLYTNSDYPFDNPTQKTVSVKGKLISINDTRYGDIESADKECSFTVKKIPSSGVMHNNNNNNNNADHLIEGNKNLLRTTIKGKANYEKIGGFLEYIDYVPVTLSISPRNFTTDSSHKIELSLLKDAHFVIEHENEIIIDVPLVNETGGLNLEPYTFDIKTPNDGGTYKSYIKDIQGYTNTPLNEVSTVIISVVQIEGEVQFFQYRQTDSKHAIYKVRVLNTNIDSSKYKLYIEYSLNGGNTWSNLIDFDGTKVFTTDPNDLEQGQEIKVNGQSYPFETNSKNVLFRSLIIAKEENEHSILIPTTGIYNETREYVSTADMATATSCTVSDKTQDYYNARQITITRPTNGSTAKYYIQRPDNTTGLTSKLEPSHPMYDVIFGQIRDKSGKVYGDTGNKNVAVLLLTENDVTLNRDNAIIVKTSEPGKDDSYFRYVFQLKKIASAPEVSTRWPKAWRDVWHEIKYIKDDLNNGYEYIICRAMMGEPYTDSRHILFNSGYSDTYWVSDYQGHTSQLQTSTSPRTRKEKYSATGEKGTFICYEVLLVIDYWNTYTQGYIAKKGMLRSDVAISTSSSEHKGEWNFSIRDVAPKTITKTRGHDLLLNKSFRYLGN